MKFKFTCLAFLALLTHTAIAAEKPNVVFILVDNVGWGAFRRLWWDDSYATDR